MNKKHFKILSIFLSIAILLGGHSEKHLSPELELGETMIIHNDHE
ncbi:hypothetical protein ACOJQI_08695 [Bacillus salacetis]